MIISNISKITYNNVMPDGKTTRENAESNAVNTEILSFSVPKTLRSDKTFVREGEIVHNTTTVTNNSSTKLFDNLFTIPAPDGASFVKGSVKINGVAQPTYDPVIGFPLPDLNSGETAVVEYDIKINDPMTTNTVNETATLKYNVTDPVRGNVSYSENTETAILTAVANRISVVKSVDKTYAVTGEILHYTIAVTNTGNIAKTDLIFKDPIPKGTTFVADSVKINGTAYSVYNPEIGFALRSLAPNEVLTVEFDVKVN